MADRSKEIQYTKTGSSYLPMMSASQPPSSEPIMPPGMKRAVVSDHNMVKEASDTPP